jgi:hypothetical protein
MENLYYTYLIGWSKLNKFYYGVRYSKNCTPEDLWKTYFTSSKYVRKFRKENGEPDIIQIRKTFNDSLKARLFENKVLKRLNVIKNEKWLNKTDNISIDPICALKGTLSHIGKKRSESTKQKLRGPKSKNHREKMKGPRPHVDQKGIKNNAFKRWYITPWGKYASISEAYINCPINISKDSIRNFCLNNDKIINKSNNLTYYKNLIGKTYKELGYNIEKAS